jgi:hypothetical protein
VPRKAPAHGIFPTLPISLSQGKYLTGLQRQEHGFTGGKSADPVRQEGRVRCRALRTRKRSMPGRHIGGQLSIPTTRVRSVLSHESIPASFVNVQNYTSGCRFSELNRLRPVRTATAPFLFDSSELYTFSDPRYMERILRTVHYPVLTTTAISTGVTTIRRD